MSTTSCLGCLEHEPEIHVLGPIDSEPKTVGVVVHYNYKGSDTYDVA
jgi:hypothetical protein